MPERFNSRFPLTSKPPLIQPNSLDKLADSEGQVLQAPKRTTPDPGWSSSAQELLDTLPRAWTKGLLYALVGFTAIGLPWAAFSKVEETGSAKGRLEPKGKSFQLDAPVAGTVTRIHVKVGQTIKAGQVLLELDSDMMQNELQRTKEQLRGLRGQAAQFELVKSQQETATRSQLSASLRSYALLRAKLAQDLNEVERYKGLQGLGAVPQVKVVEMERTVLDSQQAVEQAKAELHQTQEDRGRNIKELKARLISIYTEITQIQNQIKSLELQLKQRTIRAPVDGTVFELPIQRTGAVVQPSQLMAQVAPESSPLILRAQLPSQESGFVKVGMPVKLKFDAYPFQDYGVVQGQLHWISPDSKSVETPQGQAQVFEVEVSLDQDYISGQHQRIVLTPGQSAIAEIIVRERRVIDFALDPLKKLQRDGLKL